MNYFLKYLWENNKKINFFDSFLYGQSLATKLVVTLGYNLTQFFYLFLFGVNFDKFTIGLHLLLISSMLAKFLEN